MDSESKKLLEETHALSEENNKMLLAMRRSQRLSSIFRAVYWIFIIGTAIGAYYYIQPYLDQIMSVYSGAGDILKSFKN